ncbi:MAG: 2,5-diketo-D-gluconate reductase [Thermoleophilaceae bacterium]|jgi:diketogulonate reductase-like aldo/keto reductase|nr:2,5-diketo-D-gluconate reductase [Thermoleophilaceae bacterium]
MPAPATKTARGVEVPTVAIGVFEVDPGETAAIVADALAAGYRHVDTASAYGNEKEVGEGLRESGVDRDDVWVTTKVWIDDFAPERLRRSAESSLRRLGLDRLDLLLMHWPARDPAQHAPALEELGRLRAEGLIREFGVSNFPGYLLREVLEIAPEIFADQVEYHAKLSQRELLEIAAEHDLLIEAYAPLGGSASDMVEEPILEEIAESHGATPAQVALAWLAHQDRVAILPRSTDPGRRRENLAALEVDLTGDETRRIDELSERRERNFDPSFAPDWRD